MLRAAQSLISRLYTTRSRMTIHKITSTISIGWNFTTQSGRIWADQHRLYRAGQPQHPPACGGGWATRHHALQRRGWLTPAVGLVSDVPQLLLAACRLTPAVAAAPVDQRDGLSETLAALYAGDGRWSN